MRWRGERESENVEDRRDEGGAGGFNFPGGVSFPSGGGSGGGGIGIIGILIILGLMWFFGVDPTVLMQGGGPGGDQGNFPDIHLPQSQPGPGHLRRSRARHAGAAARASQDHQRRRPQAVRRRGARRHRGRLARHLPPVRREIQRPEARAVFRRGSLGLRHRHGSDGAVLLSRTTRKFTSTSASMTS